MRLYAERGVDGVTVREIAKAAGQKNHGAVGYHFGSKEALVKEIIADGARIIDERRCRLLDEAEANNGPRSIDEVMDILIYPALDPFEDGTDDCYMRFTAILNMTHRKLFISAIGNQWNKGYQRCLAHLRRLMPNMPASIKNQRLMFVGGYLSMMLALRQTALSDTTREHSTWPSPETLRHIAYTAAAILKAPHDEEALARLPAGVPEESSLFATG
ncbi:hypothetical protein MB02_10010 [Croceicoccus estronivorus]|nr:hypothetical protein MB02_10010 [Croceicoccus estronivorus]